MERRLYAVFFDSTRAMGLKSQGVDLSEACMFVYTTTIVRVAVYASIHAQCNNDTLSSAIASIAQTRLLDDDTEIISRAKKHAINNPETVITVSIWA